MVEGSEDTSMVMALTEWLSKWNLSDLEPQLQNNGISKPEDFKCVESKDQFQELAALLNINFIQKCKLMKAWKSFVPNPEQSVTKIRFLGDKENKIWDTLNQRFTASSDDLQYVTKSSNAFDESVFIAKQNVNTKADKMISIINNKRKEMLSEIEVITNKNQKLFKNQLHILNDINELIISKKDEFEIIASNNDIASDERLKQLEALLVMDIDTSAHEDDEKKQPDTLRTQCVIPDKVSFVFDEQSFLDSVNANISVHCDDVTTEWNLNVKPIDIDIDSFRNNKSLVFNYNKETHGHSYHVFGSNKIKRAHMNQYEWIIETTESFAGRLGIIDETNDASEQLTNGTSIHINANIAIVGTRNDKGNTYAGTLFGTNPSELSGFVQAGDTTTIRLDYANNTVTFISKIKNAQICKPISHTIESVRFIADIYYYDATITLKSAV
eukprot:1029829_1